MGPFCVTRFNPTNQLTDPNEPTTSGKKLDPTRPNPIQGNVIIRFETGSLSKMSPSNSTQQEITDAGV